MKRKKKILKPRIPKEMYTRLRHIGGAHSTPKGKKGYNRKKEKEKTRREKTPSKK